MLKLYDRIRSRREELGMTQDELAQKMGYKSRSTIHKIETGDIDIAQSTVMRIAEALNTTPEYLMGWVSSNDVVVRDEGTKKFLENFGKLNEINRNQILNIISAFLTQQTALV